MGTGKYSPTTPHCNKGFEFFKFNCYGETPIPFEDDNTDNRILSFAGYDNEGFDSYGYSAFNIDGDFVGHGMGIDRHGHTEDDYLLDSINGGDLYNDPESIKNSFVRKK
jgi:hypothetical protein